MKTYHSCFSESVILEGEEEDLVGKLHILAGDVVIAGWVLVLIADFGTLNGLRLIEAR